MDRIHYTRGVWVTDFRKHSEVHKYEASLQCSANKQNKQENMLSWLWMIYKSQNSNATKIQSRLQSCVYVCSHVCMQQQQQHIGAHVFTNAWKTPVEAKAYTSEKGQHELEGLLVSAWCRLSQLLTIPGSSSCDGQVFSASQWGSQCVQNCSYSRYCEQNESQLG
jgi:hypothetical protein